jgi:hypothetical protein
MNGLLQDVRYALRQLRKNPGFALAVVLTLALGIGVNTAVFSLLNGFLLRPLPYPQPERLGVLMLHREGVMPDTGKVVHEEEDSQDGDTWNWIRDNVPAVREASYGLVSGVNLQAGSTPGAGVRYVQEMRVSAHYFDVLGLPLLLGREFTEEEDRRGGSPVVILSYALWSSVLHGDRQVIGNEIHLKGEPWWEYCRRTGRPRRSPMYGRRSSRRQPGNVAGQIVELSCASRLARSGNRPQHKFLICGNHILMRLPTSTKGGRGFIQLR